MNLRQRHVAGALSFNRLEDIGRFDASLFGGGSRKNCDDRGVSEPLGNHCADPRLAFHFVGLECLVGLGSQIAGVGVQ